MVVGFWGQGALGPRHRGSVTRGRGLWSQVFGGRGSGALGSGTVESSAWGPWGREAEGPWVVASSALGRGFGAREVDRGVPREPVAWLF